MSTTKNGVKTTPAPRKDEVMTKGGISKNHSKTETRDWRC
jgi:hypothetical protein